MLSRGLFNGVDGMRKIVRGHRRRVGNKTVVVRPHVRKIHSDKLKKEIKKLDWKDSINFLLDLELKYYLQMTGKQILIENDGYFDYEWLEEMGFIDKEGKPLPLVNTKESKNILLEEYTNLEESYLRDDSVEELHKRIMFMIETLKKKRIDFTDILKMHYVKV